jgi:hypothetical protein
MQRVNSVQHFPGTVAQLVETLRYNRKVAGSITDGSLGVFIYLNLPAVLWLWGPLWLGKG